MAAASMKNAYSPSSFLTLQVFRLAVILHFHISIHLQLNFHHFCIVHSHSAFSQPGQKIQMDSADFLCDFFILSGPPYCTHVDVYLIPRHACFITIIMITLSKPSLLLLVITLGFVDSMKAFNLAYVGMVELYKGQFETNTFWTNTVWFSSTTESLLRCCGHQHLEDGFDTMKIQITYSKESICGSTAEGAVLDLCLLCQVLGRVHWR